jgi:hypothetical protein
MAPRGLMDQEHNTVLQPLHDSRQPLSSLLGRLQDYMAISISTYSAETLEATVDAYTSTTTLGLSDVHHLIFSPYSDLHGCTSYLCRLTLVLLKTCSCHITLLFCEAKAHHTAPRKHQIPATNRETRCVQVPAGDTPLIISSTVPGCPTLR